MDENTKKIKHKHSATNEICCPSKPKKKKKDKMDSLPTTEHEQTNLTHAIRKKSKKKKKEIDKMQYSVKSESVLKRSDNSDDKLEEAKKAEHLHNDQGDKVLVTKTKKKTGKKKARKTQQEDHIAVKEDEVSIGSDKHDTDIVNIKRSTKRKKYKKEKAKNVSKTTATLSDTVALSYLKTWYENRSQWKFQKVRQVWLLQHLYKSNKIPDEVFPSLLQYLIKLKGRARDETLSQALKIVNEDDNSEDEGNEEITMKCNRAREIIQMLS